MLPHKAGKKAVFSGEEGKKVKEKKLCEMLSYRMNHDTNIF